MAETEFVDLLGLPSVLFFIHPMNQRRVLPVLS